MFLVAVPVARMSGWCCGTPPARKSSTLSLRPTTAELRCKFSVVPSVCPIIRKQYTKNVVYWIIRLMLSLLRWPKVILLCGGHFISKCCVFILQACVIVFSTSDKSSFEAVKTWKRKVEDECGHVPMVLVQNKIDLLHEAQVDR